MAISNDNNPLSPTPGTKASDHQHPEAKHTPKYQSEKQQNSSSAPSDQNKIPNVAVYLSDEEQNELPNAVLKQVQKEVEDQSSDSNNQKPNVEDKHQLENVNEENGQIDNQMGDNDGEESDNQEGDNDEEDGHQDENIGNAEDEQEDMLQDNPMAEFRDQQTPTFEDDDEDFQCMTPPRLSHRKSKTVKRRRKNDRKQPNQNKKLSVGKTKSTTTLKGPSHKKKCLQQRSIEEIGVWVQCTDTTCTKWRYLTHITDPTQVPEVWTCEMNTDPLYNKCEAAEQNYTSLEFVFNQFTEGSVVWAKMAGYPWWPALVEEDPDLGAYMELDDKNMPVLYHVVFLDQNITRAWLSKSCLKKYEDDMFCVGTAFSKKKGYMKQVEKAKARAQSALTMSIPERVKTFGFCHNFKGTIVESQSTESQDTFKCEDFQSSNSSSTKPCNDTKHTTSHLCVDEILAIQATALLDDTQQVLANLDKSTCHQDSIDTEKTQLNRSKQEKKRMKQEKKERKTREKEEKRKLKMKRKQASKECDNCISEQTGVEKKEKKPLKPNEKMDKNVCKQKEKEEEKVIKEKEKEVKRELKKKKRDEKKKLKEQAKLEKREQLANLKEDKKMLNKLYKLDNLEEKNKAKKIKKEKQKEEKRKLKEQKKLEKKKQKELEKKTKGQGSDLQSGQKRKLDEMNASKNKQDKPVKKKLKETGDVSKEYKSKQDTSCEKPTKKPIDKVKPSFKPPSKVVPAFGISKPRESFKPPTASCHTKPEDKVTNNNIKNQKVVKDQSISSKVLDSKKVNVIEKLPSSCTTNKGDDDLEDKNNRDSIKQSSEENRVMIKGVGASIIEGDKNVDSDVVEGDKISKAKKMKFIVKRQKSSGITTSSRESANTQQPRGKEIISQDMSKLEDATNTKESLNMAQKGTESSSQESKVEKVAQCDNSMTYVEPIRDGDKTKEDLDTDSEDFCLDMNWPTEDSSNVLELESISEKVVQLLDNSQPDSQPFDIVEE